MDAASRPQLGFKPARYQGLWDHDHAFQFGIERVLDGIAALIASRQDADHSR